MMKNTKISLWKWALGACLLFLGAQNAFALKCEGTIHVKAPSGVSNLWVYSQGAFTKLKLASSGWFEASTLSFGESEDKFVLSTTGGHNPADWYDRKVTSGGDQENVFTCSDLSTGDLYIFEDPGTPGKTVVSKNPPNAKYFFVMIPPDMEEWMSSVPMLSLDGGQSGKPMTAVGDMCGWYSYVFFDTAPTDNVVLYRDDDTERIDMIGLNGNWETGVDATPIPLAMLFNVMEAAGNDTLFFVPDEEQKTNDDGYYYSAAEVDGIEGTCEYTMAAIIYDTDASLHPAFSCYTGGADCQEGAQGVDKQDALAAVNACIGVTSGIVEDTLDTSVPQNQRKPIMTNAGKKCFISEKFFKQLFNYTENVNEKSCYDMPFKRSNDGKWEFDSDYYTSDSSLKVPGGFYPVESSTDAVILAADPNQKPVKAARTKRTAEGPVFYGPVLRENDPDENIPRIDVLCKGPGWNKGIDCETLFADGEKTSTALQKHFNMTAPNDCVFGWSCKEKAPTGWNYYETGTEKIIDASDQADRRWTSKEEDKAGRNQQFCFESHAKFTYKPGLKFNFRGDDDIWVFIDDKLAVDLGGTHLAAPGYVDLDNFKGKSGSMEVGNQYDIDVFFCDRRTTMSNVRIKTNMYIQQKTDIQVKGKKNPQNPAEKVYELCYTKSGDGSCAAATSGSDEEITCCGADFTNKPECKGLAPAFFLVNGKKPTDSRVQMVPGVDTVRTPGVYKCGIDLTNVSAPVIDQKEVCLGAGRYTLFVTIEGKTRKVQSFTPAGELDVVYEDAESWYIDEEDSKNDKKLGEYHLTGTEMGGKLVEVYVSNIGEGGDDGKKIVQPSLAVGVSYSLSFDPLLRVYYKNEAGEYVKVNPGDARVIGESGVDTLYATVQMDDMTEAIQEFSISVTNRPNAQKIKFYLPVISFVSAPDSTAKQVTGQKPEADGSFEEYWVGSIYDLYLAILKPDDSGKYYPCKEDCEGLKIHKGSETSPRIDFIPEEVEFHDGYATISVRSLTKYRWDTDPSIHSPAQIVAEYNDYVKAVYSPMYFRDPPVPYPVLADVFDVKGALPTEAYKMPESYFRLDQEYLDGIGDSVAIYYDREIHKDSIPTVICIMWDSTAVEEDNPELPGAITEHNPVAEGFSNIPKDTSISCNAIVKKDKINVDCSKLVEVNGISGYCTNVVKIGDVTLSRQVKTQGVGKVHSYAEFEDKGKKVKQGFVGALTDRIAPIPLRAEVRSLRDGDELNGYDSLVVYFSEPVKLITSDFKKKSMNYYLNSAIELSETQRFVDEHSDVTADMEPAVTSEMNEVDNRLEGRVKFIYKPGKEGSSNKKVTPHVGDYVRMGGSMANVFWADTVNLASSDAGNTIRGANDGNFNWNSPTAYDESARIPSPWIPVVGDADIDVVQNKFSSTANADSNWLVTQQAITVDGYRTNVTKDEVLRDQKGRPGHFVKADMYALINGLSKEEKAELLASLDDVFFFYEVQYFTNLGSYVAGKSQKIFCKDDLNYANNGQYFFGGPNTTCMDAGMDRNFYIGWNMRSDKGRMVGTGAYIVKLKSYVRLGSVGKDAKQETTSVWGVKRSPVVYTGWMANPAAAAAEEAAAAAAGN